jgi:hypothetical protein
VANAPAFEEENLLVFEEWFCPSIIENIRENPVFRWPPSIRRLPGDIRRHISRRNAVPDKPKADVPFDHPAA